LIKYLISFILFITTSLPLLADAPYSYSYIPKFVYKNQVFPVTVYVKYYNPKNPPNFEFEPIALNQPINSKPVIVINKKEAFFTFYFKAPNKKSMEIPSLSIWTLDHSFTLNGIEIKVKDLNIKSRYFSNVIASKLRVISTKVDSYDSNYNLVTFNLEATEANLEDMHIPNVIDDGVENLKRDGANVYASYYFIIPSKIDLIKFSYYNSIKNSFVTKKISLSNQKDSIDSSSLNPKELSFDKIKKYFTIAAIIILTIAFILTKEYIYLIFSIISFIILIAIFIPKKSICIKEGAPLYILPTKNSNISMHIDKKIQTPLLHKYKNYNKIEINSISGWVKDEDLCKD